MNKRYIEGFILKCSQLGVDPEALIKAAAGKIPLSLSGKMLQPVKAKAPSLMNKAVSGISKHPWLAAGGAAAGALGLEGLGHYLSNDAPMPKARHDAQLLGSEAPGVLQQGRSTVDPVIEGGPVKAKAAPVKPGRSFMTPFKGPLSNDKDTHVPQIGRDPEGNPI